MKKLLHVDWVHLEFIGNASRYMIVGRFANESFRQPSVRKRVGSIRKRLIVGSPTS